MNEKQPWRAVWPCQATHMVPHARVMPQLQQTNTHKQGSKVQKPVPYRPSKPAPGSNDNMHSAAKHHNTCEPRLHQGCGSHTSQMLGASCNTYGRVAESCNITHTDAMSDLSSSQKLKHVSDRTNSSLHRCNNQKRDSELAALRKQSSMATPSGRALISLPHGEKDRRLEIT